MLPIEFTDRYMRKLWERIMKTAANLCQVILSECLLGLVLILLALLSCLPRLSLVSQERGSLSLEMFDSTWRTRKRSDFRKFFTKVGNLLLRTIQYVFCGLTFPSYVLNLLTQNHACPVRYQESKEPRRKLASGHR